MVLRGRRIISITDFLEQVKELNSHSPMDCNFSHMQFLRERRIGLISGFTFECSMCGFENTIWSEKEKEDVMDLNTSAVSGTITTGGGHAQLEELLSTMGIPSMSDKTFKRYENNVSRGFMATAEREMKEAAEEEARIAVEAGDVDKNGVPLLTVVADGSWGKRSYRTNYSSLSGVAAIVGHHTRKVLYMGVKNIYCTPCAYIKHVGGKRINFGLRGSYQGRCAAAVVQHNSGDTHYKLHKQMYESSPGHYSKSTGIKRKRKVERQRGKKSRRSLFSTSQPDEDYGPEAQRPDLEEEIMAKETQEYLKSITKTPDQISTIELETRGQRDSGAWLETRRTLLTASNFSRVCHMKATTACESLVKQMLYSAFDCEAMAYGRKNEATAKQQVQEVLGLTVELCGLFIDPEINFLGATPDGIIGEDGLLEIKCPSSAKDMTPEEAILKRKVTFWTKNKDGSIGGFNKNHPYFYQIQGQLHITRRMYCVFALWTPKGLRTANIDRDDEFWETKMRPKLEKFYLNCVVPEIIDPRHNRSVSIRNPQYIL